MIVKDKDADKTFVYFLTSYYFHWTPEQTDSTEARLVEGLLAMLPMWRKKENEKKNEGA